MALNKPNLPEGRGGAIGIKIKTSGLFPVPVAINSVSMEGGHDIGGMSGRPHGRPAPSPSPKFSCIHTNSVLYSAATLHIDEE